MRKISTFAKLPLVQKLVFFEALFWLIIAWCIRRFIPFNVWVKRLGQIGSTSDEEPLSPDVEARVMLVSQALQMWGKLSRTLGNCLVKSIAAKLMLKRRGIQSTLYLGVITSHSNDQLHIVAHSWVRCSTVFIGGQGKGLTELLHVGDMK